MLTYIHIEGDLLKSVAKWRKERADSKAIVKLISIEDEKLVNIRKWQMHMADRIFIVKYITK